MKVFIFISIIFLAVPSAFANENDSAVNFIATDNAAKPVGAYSQATTVDLQKGKLLFIAGQLPNDPKTGKFIEGDIQSATHQVLNNMEAILKAAGSDWKYVLRVDVFLRDIHDWGGMNQEYMKRFPNGVYPARQAIQTAIKDRVEISAIAFVPYNNSQTP